MQNKIHGPPPRLLAARMLAVGFRTVDVVARYGIPGRTIQAWVLEAGWPDVLEAARADAIAALALGEPLEVPRTDRGARALADLLAAAAEHDDAR